MGEPAPKEEKITLDSKADDIIQREYSAWAVRHGKVKSAKRFEIFRRNFVKQMEMNRKNGEFFLLNEYGDLTEVEYISALRKSKESKGKEDKKREESADTLPAAPVKRLEDLTQEVLDSAMASSRKYIAEKQRMKKEAEKAKPVGIEPEKSLTKNVYKYLLETVRGLTEEEWEITRAQHTNPYGFQSNPIFMSYIDLLYAPMQPLDNFDVPPTHLSAAITPSLQTIQNYLIEEIDLEWAKHAYAMNFEGDEWYN